MDYICADNNNTKWVFDGEYYLRQDAKGNMVRKIAPEYLPDPQQLWTDRMVAMPDTDPMKHKPSQATFNLWEHKQWLQTQQITA